MAVTAISGFWWVREKKETFVGGNRQLQCLSFLVSPQPTWHRAQQQDPKQLSRIYCILLCVVTYLQYIHYEIVYTPLSLSRDNHCSTRTSNVTTLNHLIVHFGTTSHICCNPRCRGGISGCSNVLLTNASTEGQLRQDGRKLGRPSTIFIIHSIRLMRKLIYSECFWINCEFWYEMYSIMA